jgi:hypothetical protein
MVLRLGSIGRVVALAIILAISGFGVAGYGAFGPLPATSAILETTAQSPLDVLPRPSTAPGGQPAPGSIETHGATNTAPPVELVVAGVIVALGAGIAVRASRRRSVA